MQAQFFGIVDRDTLFFGRFISGFKLLAASRKLGVWWGEGVVWKVKLFENMLKAASLGLLPYLS